VLEVAESFFLVGIVPGELLEHGEDAAAERAVAPDQDGEGGQESGG